MPAIDERRATLFALLAVLCWSTVATAFKLSLEVLTPLQLLAWASVAATLALGVLVGASGGLPRLLASSRADLRRSLGLGLLNPVLYYLLLFAAYERLPAQEAQPLNFTWAFALALLSVPLLGHRLSRWDLLGGVVAYGGVLVIATRGAVWSLEFSDGPGVALALASAIPWALYWIWGARDRRDPLIALFTHFMMATPLLLLLCHLSDGLRVPMPGLLGAFYVGLVEMAFGFALWLTAMRHTAHASSIGNLIFIAPFLSLWFIATVLGERILSSTWVGLVLIVAGLLLQRLCNGRAQIERAGEG